MPPDFSQKTIDTLAKRAAYLCSNPDCRASTVGPHSEPTKATTIGEAAHIFGARPNSARYDQNMSDASRAEITNGIWLCRNCHKLVDHDPHVYTAEVLFAWHEQHDQFVGAELGNAKERIQYNQDTALLQPFSDYPSIVRRIVLDKPPGWEWRLTAELLRYLNSPSFRKLRDLREGLYTKQVEHIRDEEVLSWVGQRSHEMSSLVAPIEKLLVKLSESWGAPGEPGNIDEIHHSCLLLRDYLAQIVQHEERMRFVHVSDDFQKMISMMQDLMGSQVEKLASVPDTLDEIVALIDTEHEGTEDNPKCIRKTITFEMPDNWAEKMNKEILRAEKKLTHDNVSGTSPSGNTGMQNMGCVSGFFWGLVVIFLLMLFF